MIKINLPHSSNTILSFPLSQSTKEIEHDHLGILTARIIILFGIIHIMAGLFLYYFNLPLFLRYVTEDSYIEYLTAFFLLITSFYCLYKGLIIQKNIRATFFCLMAILFFFGFGEEISWGQRLFGFETPTELKSINSQQEFNLHNVMVGEVKLNKIIFGKIMYLALFIYFLLFNVLYKRKTWFRKMIDNIGIPLPAPEYSLLFVFTFLAVTLIKNGEKWELDEFAIALFAFVCFFQPYNKKLQQQLAHKITPQPAGKPGAFHPEANPS